MAEDLSHWTPRPRPSIRTLEGRFVRLEKLDPGQHAAELFETSAQPDGAERFRWLSDHAPDNPAALRDWAEKASASKDPLHFAAIDKVSGKVAGRQAFMRVDEANGVAEIGHIYWGPLMSRQPAATEALFLFARHLFEDLGYRRFEWKCDSENLPSKRAALRFGFRHEGIFHQHLIVKGLNRDTAWYAMLDKDWENLAPTYAAWLAPENFDADGMQIRRLEEFRKKFDAA